MSYRDKVRLIAVREQLGIARRALRLIADGAGYPMVPDGMAAEQALEEIEQIELTRLRNPATQES